jgi:hypothetical protein
MQPEMMPTGGPQNTSVWGGIGGFLGQAVDAYGKFEDIKKLKNSTGQSRVDREFQPELENGASRQVEAPKTLAVTPQETKIFGVMTQKQALMAAGGLTILLVVLKVAK